MPSFFSHAKINLGLQVLSKREDNYHNLHSLFVEVDLSDKLVFKPADDFHLTLKGSTITEMPLDETNLIDQAYKLIKMAMKSVPTEYSIQVKKQIPIGRGLGGGSSNAATTLIALNQLWQLNLAVDDLENMGKSLGADVPFFIRGGTQVVEGMGDLLSPINPGPLKNLKFLLVIPPVFISTPWAYETLNKT